MKKQKYKEVLLSEVVPNSMNPRKRFEGPKFDELVASVKSKGVLEPILVRPLGEVYEIVAGERRFRAASAVAKENGGLDGAKIPAMVRELSDDDAFDIMTIENLQREDLNPLEEAVAFKVFTDKRGPESIVDLAERTGISPAYIRKRLRVLELPDYIKKEWEAGTITFSHLEQFARLKDPEILKREFEGMMEFGSPVSVRQLRDSINNLAPALHGAPFDKKATGCARCMCNSQVQKKLFDDTDDLKGVHCLNPACFKINVKAWFVENWAESDLRKTEKTAGVMFKEEISGTDCHQLYSWDPIFPKCRKCDKHISLINTKGMPDWPPRVCLDPACYTDLNLSAKKEKAAGKTDGTADGRQTPSWHGEYFREKFYTKRIPAIVSEIPADSDNAHSIALLALLHSNNDIAQDFVVQQGLKDESGYNFISNKQLVELVISLPDATVQEILKECAAAAIVQQRFGQKARHALAPVLGISLADEFCIDEEWLDKKTKAELIEFIESPALLGNSMLEGFLTGTLGKKPRRWDTCKKSELKQLLLESGVDLTGIVPAEVLAVKE